MKYKLFTNIKISTYIFFALFLVLILSIIAFAIISGIIGDSIYSKLVFLGISAFLLLLVSKRISRKMNFQLEKINRAINLIIDGDFQERIPIDDARFFSEIYKFGELANKLADKVERDIAEMKRLERVRSEFLGNVSHELRTPIFSIQGFLETLIDGAIDDKEVRLNFVEKAYSNSVRLNNLLSDLIDISRIESGEMRLAFRYFNMSEFLRELVGAMEGTSKQKHVELIFEESERDIFAYGDKERLAQVMTNLVDNAIKYNKENGKVFVTIHSINKDCVVTVQDTGIGLAQEHIDRIFERFYRVDKVRSREIGGTGLGLAIVKHILEAHKSVIKVESTLGAGTRISFTLKKSED